jgi:sugar phosphate isomerase/epimerase
MFMAAGKARKQIGLQLYTLRDTISKDPKGVLGKVATYGYKLLETYGYGEGRIFGMEFQEFVKYAKGLGMKVTSGHYALNAIKGDAWLRAVEDAKKAGQEYMVIAYINEPERQTLDQYKQICADLNAAGEVCNQNQIRFGYHNHAFEFEKIDDMVPYDLMLKELDTVNVGMEMDIFWVVNAGQDPVDYFKKYPGRFEQWHVKDMDKSDRNRNADVGTGSIDFKAIFNSAKTG